MLKHRWSPTQYKKFEAARSQPFFDLLKLISPQDSPHLLDLGCGDGKLTLTAHQELKAITTLGIDSSPEMLQQAQVLHEPDLSFQNEDIQTFHPKTKFHCIISNAALQWVPNHRELFSTITNLLEPEGQIAFQMPINQQFPTHLIAADLASEQPYCLTITERRATNNVLDMEEYAYLLDTLGFEQQVIRSQIYVHYLESTSSAVDWVQGSLLTYYQSQLTEELYEAFLEEYRKRIIAHFGWSEPFLFPIKRLFIWGQL